MWYNSASTAVKVNKIIMIINDWNSQLLNETKPHKTRIMLSKRLEARFFSIFFIIFRAYLTEEWYVYGDLKAQRRKKGSAFGRKMKREIRCSKILLTTTTTVKHTYRLDHSVEKQWWSVRKYGLKKNCGVIKCGVKIGASDSFFFFCCWVKTKG